METETSKLALARLIMFLLIVIVAILASRVESNSPEHATPLKSFAPDSDR